MGELHVVKGHATENDFVVLPDLDGSFGLTADLVRALCDRRAGVGGDGVLRVVRTSAVPEVADQAGTCSWFMDYRNADGSTAEMCGNGIRLYAKYLVSAGLAAPGELRVATRGGPRRVLVEDADGDVTVDMGPPHLAAGPGPLVRVGERTWPSRAVSMGNPHVVVEVADLDDAGELREPPVLDPAPPQGANVEFVVRRGAGRVAFRVFERGVGETRSCGTGACAVVAAVAADDGPAAPVGYEVEVPGGGLQVSAAPDGALLLRGPAVLVGEVRLDTRWLQGLRTEALPTESLPAEPV